MAENGITSIEVETESGTEEYDSLDELLKDLPKYDELGDELAEFLGEIEKRQIKVEEDLDEMQDEQQDLRHLLRNSNTNQIEGRLDRLENQLDELHNPMNQGNLPSRQRGNAQSQAQQQEDMSNYRMDSANVDFEDIGGLDREIRSIKESIGLSHKYPQFNDIREPASTLLFIGPPGTGKTLSARATANEYDMNPFRIKASEIVEGTVGSTSGTLNAIYEMAEERQPSILFIDELDALATERGSTKFNNVNERVNGMLNSILEGPDETGEVYLMATTNKPESLDGALKSRFDTEIRFERPKEDETYDIAIKYFPESIAERVTDKIVSNNDYMEVNSGRNIKNTLKKAINIYLGEVEFGDEELPEELQIENEEAGRGLPAELQSEAGYERTERNVFVPKAVEVDDLVHIDQDYFLEAVDRVYGAEVEEEQGEAYQKTRDYIGS